MNNHDWHSYFGPLMGWLVNALMWVIGGMSPLAALGAVAALWWTVERALTERTRRNMLDNLAGEAKTKGGFAARLRAAMKTQPGDL